MWHAGGVYIFKHGQYISNISLYLASEHVRMLILSNYVLQALINRIYKCCHTCVI